MQSENYVRGVSFDTMTNKDLPDYSFTLRGKSPGYKRTRRSRTFLVATDLASYSDHALKFAINDVMDDGDEIIVLRVVSVDVNDKKSLTEKSLKHQEKQARENATKVMERIMETGNEDKKISAIIEFVIGKIHQTIQHMISMYQPSLLIVGTRGLSEFQGMLLGSVSKYCLQHCQIPVTVVRPQEAIKKQLDNKKNKDKKKKGISGLLRYNSTSPTGSDDDERSNDQSTPTQQMRHLTVV
ncbi:hypothetical protein BJ944DRAFT_258290 [Cunninghamella echinulata]|nr:hypothetical protein BJ944DRAFT_258290 [Cunninghamella echinulata]